MTAPNAGEAEVDIVADLSRFAAGLRKEVESAFRGLDFDKLIREAVGDKPIRIPVVPQFDQKSLPKSLPRQRPVRVPAEVDPLFDQFRQEVRRQADALAKQVNARIPVDADTDGVRAELGAQLGELGKQLRLQVPAEPADRAAFQTKLQEQLAEVRARVKAVVPVDADTSGIAAKVRATPVPKVRAEVDPVLQAFQAQVRSQVAALSRSVNANIPVGADTAGLRAQLGAQLAEIRSSLSVEVPTEPGARAEYEARLKAQLAEVSHRVKQSVPVDVDTKGAGSGGFLSALLDKLPGIGSIGSAVSGISSALSGLAGNLGPVGGAIGSLVSGFGSLIGVAALVPPALAAIAGALASLPTLLTGAGAGFGTLLLGFKGIGEALTAKPKGGGGGGAGQSAAQQARQVAAAGRQVEAARRGITSANRAYEASERSLAAAERGVAAAQRNLVDAEAAVAVAQQRSRQAQEAVNQARRDAVDDLIDLNLQLKDSRLSEEEAALAVTDALRELNTVKLTGNIPDIQKADLAYQRAQLTLEEATQSSKELQKQTDSANKKGVEGSDKVQSALKDQADALDGVKKAQQGVLDAQNGILDASDSLKSAQDGVKSAADGIKSATDSLAAAQDGLAQAQTKQATAGAAAAAMMTKLAPNASKFVEALKALKPAFDGLRLDVQQRLFAGLDQTVTRLGEAWIPALRTTLGRYADTFNGFFRDLGRSVSTPKFISDISAGAEGARQGLSKIGEAVSRDLVPAFGTLSRAAAPFVSQVGGWIAKAVTEFSRWVEKANKSGKLQEFFDRAAKAFHEIGTSGKLGLQIVGDLFEIITGSDSKSGKSPLDGFNDSLRKVHEWLSDPKHQQEIRDFIDDVKDLAGKFAKAVGKIDDFLDRLHKIPGEVDSIGDKVRGFFNRLFGFDDDNGKSSAGGKSIGQSLGDGLLEGLKNALGNVGGFLAGLLWSGPDSLVGKIKAGLGIASPSTVMMEVGGNLIDGLIVGIGDKFGQLGDFVRGIPTLIRNRLSDAGSWLRTHGQQAIGGLSSGISNQFTNLRTTAGNARNVVQGALGTAGTWLRTHGQAAIQGLGGGITSMFGNLRTWAAGAKSWVQSAVSGAANWLVSDGRNLVIGLWNGVVSKGQWLYDKLIGWARTYIPGPIRSALGIASPSKVGHEIGAYFGEGLELGIASRTQRVSDAADALAAAAVPQVDPTFGLDSGLDAALSTSLQSASQQQIVLSWANGTSVDPVLRAFQDLINARYRGNVQAAFTGK